jgi:hypothetical protein
MRRNSDLEARLEEWAREYGGTRYEDNGWQGISPLASIIKYHGRAPQGLNPRRIETNGTADEVEVAVRALEAQKVGAVPAAVIRCHYFAGDVPRDIRLQRLAKVGNRMESTRYSHHLRMAKMHVAAWLHLPFSEPLQDADAIAMLEYVVTMEKIESPA